MNINMYDLTEKNVELNISAELLKIFKNKMPVVLCLGNDKVLSDSVGVLVAEKLRETGYNNYVFGGFCNPLNKDNLMCILKKFPNQNFLFIDSSLSDFKNKIVLNKKQIKLSNGKVFNGVSLCASTISQKNGKLILAGTKFNKVLQFANIIARAVDIFSGYAEILKS